jgi:hypothetical protein
MQASGIFILSLIRCYFPTTITIVVLFAPLKIKDKAENSDEMVHRLAQSPWMRWFGKKYRTIKLNSDAYQSSAEFASSFCSGRALSLSESIHTLSYCLTDSKKVPSSSDSCQPPKKRDIVLEK